MKNKRLFFFIILFCILMFILSFCQKALFPVDNIYIVDNELIYNILKSIVYVVLLISSFIYFKGNVQSYKEKNNEMYNLKELFVFSLLFSYKFIYLYVNNINVLPFIWGASAILFSISLFFMIYKILRVVFKNQSFAIITTLILSVLIFDVQFVQNYAIDLIIFGFVYVSLFFNFEWKNVLTFLKYFSFAIITLCIIQGTMDLFISKPQTIKKEKLNQDISYLFDKIKKDPSRDIYILVLDMYAGDSTLKQFGYDNSPFFNSLEERGFNVHKNIFSNYNRTQLCLPSFLNFKYVDTMNYKTHGEAISKAELFKMSKYVGYKNYFINAWPLHIKIFPRFIDESYDSDYSMWNEILTLLLKNTLFEPLIYSIDVDNPIQNSIYCLEKIVRDNSRKKLVLAHFLMPHEPFLYDENGNSIPKKYRDYIFNEQDKTIHINKKNYISYLKYSNIKMIKIIDYIMKNSKEKPIIILMGDHGTRTFRYQTDENKYMSEILKYKNSIFNTTLAYYNPDIEYDANDETADILNFFINFSNENFGTEIKNVERKHYYIYTGSNCSNLRKLTGEYIDIE